MNLKKMLNSKKISFFASLFILTAFFYSCDFFSLTSSLESSKDSSKKIYVLLKNVSLARSIGSTAIDTSSLTDYSLNCSYGSQIIQKNWDSLEKITPIELSSTGAWTFTLSAKKDGITFSDTITKEITMGTNSLSFNLCAPEGLGGGISVTVSSDSSQAYCTVELTTLNGTSVEEKELTNSDGSFTYEKSSALDATDSSKNLSAGLYRLVFKFYGDDEKTIYLNTYDPIVRVVDGIVTQAQIKISLNTLYTITYYCDDKEITDDDWNDLLKDSSSIVTTKYSRHTFDNLDEDGISFPELQKNNALFLGWYNESSTKIDSLAKGTASNLTLYAHFADPVQYVSNSNSSDSNDGLTQNTMVNTLSKALENINSYQTSCDWTIYISGKIKENTTLSDSGDNATLSEYVKSILIYGDGTDILDGNMSESTLTINTATIPVTIEGLLIQNGSSQNGGGINKSGPAAFFIYNCTICSNTATGNGGGIYLADTANIAYISNCTIIRNSASNGSGGGLYVGSGVTVFIYNNSNIGECANEENKQVATSTEYSNTAKNGAGIYSKGDLYIGYSAYSDEETNTSSEGQTSVCYNYSSSTGAGIYIYSGAFAYYNANISYNYSASGAGGIYTNYDSSDKITSFFVNGGSISYNDAKGSGGGITSYLLESDSVLDSVKFEHNNATVNGGAIFITKGKFITLKDCSLNDNTATGSGNAVYATGTLILKGSSNIDSSNSVFLPSGSKIKLPEILSNSSVATITPASYAVGTQILSGDYVSSNYQKFTLSDTSQNVQIGSSGYLEETISNEANYSVYYVDSSASIDSPNGSYSKPYATLKDALSAMGNSSYTNSTQNKIYLLSDLTITQGQGGTTSGLVVSIIGAGNTKKNIYCNTQTQSALQIINNQNFTIKNITFTQSSSTSNSYCAIFLGQEASSTVTEASSGTLLLQDVSFDSLQSESCPAIVAVTKSSLILNGVEFKNCTATGEAAVNNSYTALIDIKGESTLTLSGKINIDSSNVVNSTTTPLEIWFGSNNDDYKSSPIKITDSLTDSTIPIHYVSSNAPTSTETEFAITSGWSTYCSSCTASSIFSETSGSYEVTQSDDGEILLKAKTTAISMSNFSTTNLPQTGQTVAIQNETELTLLATIVNAGNTLEGVTFILDSDISLTNDYTPIGQKNYPFSGTFDGQNHSVTGLTKTSSQTYTGFFGNVQNAVIKNVSLAGSFTASNYSGGLVGCSNGNLTVDNCDITIQMTGGGKYIGGIVGYLGPYNSAGDILITNCINRGSIDGSESLGGIVGQVTSTINSCTIKNSANLGKIACSSTSPKSVGGILGLSNCEKTSFLNCVNSGQISSEVSGDNYGAIAGYVTSYNSESIDNYFYLENTATQFVYTNSTSISTWGSICGTFKEEGASLTLIQTVTYSGSSYTDLITLLNAWSTQNTTENLTFKNWLYSESSLKFSD